MLSLSSAQPHPTAADAARSLLEFVVSDSRLQQVHRGVLATELSVDLVEDAYTLLAPTDGAFRQLQTLDGLFDDPERLEECFDLFSFFLIRGCVDCPSRAYRAALTVHGEQVLLGAGQVKTRCGSARIIETIRFARGVIHLLDAVVTPSLGVSGPTTAASGRSE